MSYMSHVTSHMKLTPTTTATDPPPANSSTMHCRMVCTDPKKAFINGSILDHILHQIWNSETAYLLNHFLKLDRVALLITDPPPTVSPLCQEWEFFVTLHLTCDMGHMTNDTWHMTHDRWGDVNLF